MGHGIKEYASMTNKQFLAVKGAKVGLRERRAKKSFMSVAVDVLFTQLGEFSQMTAKAGIKRFRDRAIVAMLQEFKQLNKGAVPNKPVIQPVSPKEITQEEKDLALSVVMLIKEKRDGTLK